jgi:hypothetical protein
VATGNTGSRRQNESGQRRALFADVESGELYNAERRHALLANLKQAQDEFFQMVAQLHE